MKTILLALIAATFVDALVEYGNTIYEMIMDGEYQKAVKQGCAIALGLLFSFQVGVHLLAHFTTELDVAINPVFDMIISGIVLSRGANYISDLCRLISYLGNKLRDGDDGDVEEEEDDDEPTSEDYTNYIL